MVIIIIILWKCVYPSKKKIDKESGYLYLNPTQYMNPEWQDSWPNQ